MARKRNRSASPSPSASDQGTRAHLLETAGQIFAEKGFDRATGKEICKRARVNAAAVNYHFGGMEGLYEAVVWEAHNRLVTFDTRSPGSRAPDRLRSTAPAASEGPLAPGAAVRRRCPE